MSKKINHTEALLKLAGNKNLYLKICSKYLEEYSNSPEILKNHLSQEEFKEAAIYAHTLKGITGTVGAVELQSICSHLENEINTNQNPDTINKLIVQFENESNMVNQEITNFINQESV